MTAFQQRSWIKRKALNPYETCLVAVHENEVIGILESWTDRRARAKHVTTFSMSTHSDWRGKGLGQKLLNTFIEWIRQHEQVNKIELHVHSDNAAAIHLYKNAGFTVEGTRKNAIVYEDERFVDDILMACWPDSSNVEVDMET